MTTSDIEKLRGLLPRIPWYADDIYVVGVDAGGRPGGEVIAKCEPTAYSLFDKAKGRELAQKIVTLVNALPELLAEYERLLRQRRPHGTLEECKRTTPEWERLPEALRKTKMYLEAQQFFPAIELGPQPTRFVHGLLTELYTAVLAEQPRAVPTGKQEDHNAER